MIDNRLRQIVQSEIEAIDPSQGDLADVLRRGRRRRRTRFVAQTLGVTAVIGLIGISGLIGTRGVRAPEVAAPEAAADLALIVADGDGPGPLAERLALLGGPPVVAGTATHLGSVATPSGRFDIVSYRSIGGDPRFPDTEVTCNAVVSVDADWSEASCDGPLVDMSGYRYGYGIGDVGYTVFMNSPDGTANATVTTANGQTIYIQTASTTDFIFAVWDLSWGPPDGIGFIDDHGNTIERLSFDDIETASTLPEDAVPEACDPTAAIRLAEEAAAELGQPDVTGWQEGLEGPIVERRMPAAHDLAMGTDLRCEWEGSIPSPDGEWIAASVAWSGQDMLGVIRLTHPPNQNYGDEAVYGFEETGVITGTWVTPSVFAGIADGELTAVFRLGSVEPPTAPATTTNTTIDFGVCPGVVPGFLPEGVEGGPGTQPNVVWESTGATQISIARSASPDHPAASLSNTTSVEFDGGSASYVSLRPDDPRPNFAARIDIDGTDPACGILFATFERLDSEDVERILASLTVVQPGQ